MTQNRRPPGTPAGGRFSAQTHAEAEGVSLQLIDSDADQSTVRGAGPGMHTGGDDANGRQEPFAVPAHLVVVGDHVQPNMFVGSVEPRPDGATNIRLVTGDGEPISSVGLHLGSSLSYFPGGTSAHESRRAVRLLEDVDRVAARHREIRDALDEARSDKNESPAEIMRLEKARSEIERDAVAAVLKAGR